MNLKTTVWVSGRILSRLTVVTMCNHTLLNGTNRISLCVCDFLICLHERLCFCTCLHFCRRCQICVKCPNAVDNAFVFAYMCSVRVHPWTRSHSFLGRHSSSWPLYWGTCCCFYAVCIFSPSPVSARSAQPKSWRGGHMRVKVMAILMDSGRCSFFRIIH